MTSDTKNLLLITILCVTALSSSFSQKQQTRLMLPIGHSQPVRSVRYNSDGKLIVTSSWDRTAKIWDTETGLLLNTLNGHQEAVSLAQFSPNGKQIFTVGDDRTLKLWDVTEGELLKNFIHNDEIKSAKFSPGGNTIMTCSEYYSTDKKSRIWDVSTGELLLTMEGRFGDYSPDGKFALSILGVKKDENLESTKTLMIWDLNSAKLFKTVTLNEPINAAQYSPNGQRILVQCNSGLKILDSKGQIILEFPISGDEKESVFSHDGKKIATSLRTKTIIWNTENGSIITTLPTFLSDGLKFNIYNTLLLTEDVNDTIRVWQVETGKQMASFSGRGYSIDSQFSPDGKSVSTVFELTWPSIWNLAPKISLRYSLFGSQSSSLIALSHNSELLASVNQVPCVREIQTGKLKYSLSGHEESVRAIQFSHDGSQIATTDSRGIIKIWSASSGKFLGDINGHDPGEPVVSVQFSYDDKKLLTSSTDYTARIWNLADRKQLTKLYANAWYSYAEFHPKANEIIVSADGTKIIEYDTKKIKLQVEPSKMASFNSDGSRFVMCHDSTAKVFDVTSGTNLFKLKGHSQDINEIKFSKTGSYILSASSDKTAKIWKANNGELYKTLKGHTQEVTSITSSNDDKWIITSSEDNSIKFWDISTGNELLSIYQFDSINNVIIHPSGLFDATPEAMKKLYFVQGLTIIQIDQLKDRYYEPGLWKKIMSGEKLRNVVGFKSIDLPPDIRVGEVDTKGYLPIELTNRGGGIGEVTVYIHGKEVIKDVRDKKANPDAPSMKINYYVGNHKNLAKGENLIAVKAWNKDHWVESRGEVVSYTKGENDNYQPTVHIITCGISDYAGGADIDLTYAAKDAEDVSKALKLGASKLFGVQKSNVYNLTTSQAKESWPTKTNILKTFDKISSTAHPLDVIVVYLSGHGINIGGADGDWHYLTQEAYTPSAPAYSDPAIRKQTTISSNELVELFKTIPAAKQVLIIDACASGKVVDNLIAKKDVPSSTLRALDRMKDRTGMHIITGCTADAVSYEASRYGQGVLTYSLLEGIRGAALREDEFVDVNKLFQYAQDRVPVLATGIGGIQTPMIFSPNGSQSFDIGQLTEIEKKEVPISKIRPVYIQSNFQDEDEMSDVLGLGKTVDQLLGESAAKGTEAPLIFVPVREYPDGCQLVGRYKKENGKIVMKLKKKCEGKDSTVDIIGTDLNDISNQVFKVITN